MGVPAGVVTTEVGVAVTVGEFVGVGVPAGVVTVGVAVGEFVGVGVGVRLSQLVVLAIFSRPGVAQC